MMTLLFFLSLAGIGWGVTALALHYRAELTHISYADARRLASLPTTRLADVQDGALVKVVGTVASEQSVMSYFDRVPCVARKIEFRSHVETRVELGWSGLQTVDVTQIERELRAFPFTVNDGSGSVLLDPRRTQFDFEVAGGEEGSSVHEHRIRIGEKVAVVGLAKVDRDGGYREASTGPRVSFPGRVLVSWRSDEEFVPKTRPPMMALVLLAIGVACGAGYGGLLMQQNARRDAWRARAMQRAW